MKRIGLIKYKVLTAIRYLNGDYREFLRLERAAIKAYDQLKTEEMKRRGLVITIGEYIKHKKIG